MVSQEIGRAMAAQLERVNGHGQVAGAADGVIASQKAEIERLQSLLQSAREQLKFEKAENERLLERLAALDGDTPQARMTYNGWPVLTVKEAAKSARVSVSTVIRYLNSGWWLGKQMPGSNRWMVDGTQALLVKSAAKRK